VSVSLSFEATSEILGSVKIPAAPAVFMQLHELMQRDEPDIGEVAQVISRDVGLAALVLKTVNSPFFGLRSEVSSIRQATTLLGLLNIGNIVAGLALRRAMEDAGGPSPEHYWESPANVGMVAAHLARRFPGVAPDEAYMLGLFHNVGVPLMMQRFEDYLTFTRGGGLSGPELVAAEDAKYSTNHAVVGYYVCRSWKLPVHIGDLILNHHDVHSGLSDAGGLIGRDRLMLAVLKMAEHIDGRYWGRTDDPEWASCADAVLGFVGMSEEDFADVVDDMVELLSQQ
jgi:HD-like signal output (HDOD) protein